MMQRTALALAVSALAMAARLSAAQQPLLVAHEWGTITTHHAPDGTPRGRLNHVTGTDTLPPFVHGYEPPEAGRDPERSLVKTALVAGRPDVTMRLETPVMYFYPPHGAGVPAFDVTVRFRGGILNEFYPNGDASLVSRWNGEVLNGDVVGALTWRGVTLADTVPLTRTTSHVWLAPRGVKAAGVTVGRESERYLFYRGVAHLEAVLQTRVTSSDVRLLAPRDLEWLRATSMTVPRVWLVEILPNGSMAFRESGPLTIAKAAPSRELGRLDLFAKEEYGTGKLTELRERMRRALIEAGLYETEAHAMLETWKESYFHSPGLRVFYLVPNEWTRSFLPLEISAPTALTRVLVGRIDLERGRVN